MSGLVAEGFVAEALALGDPLDLAGPYLSGGVLRRLRPRRVLVDVEAWAASSSESLVEAFDALPGCAWRHLRGLHAKVAVGPCGALVGSANWTLGGTEKNVELGVRVDDPVGTQAWFETRWDGAAAFGREDLAMYEASRPVVPPRAACPPFRTSERPLPLCVAGCALSGEDEARLVGALRRFPDGATARAYLDLLRRFYDDLGLPSDDARLSLLSVGREGEVVFRVNVNNRIALTWYAFDGGFLGFTVVDEVAERLLGSDDLVEGDWEFASVPRRPDSVHLRLPRPQDLAGRREAWSAVIDWARLELPTSRSMGGRRVYEPAAGRLVYDGAMRERLFAEAFGAEEAETP